MGDLNFTAAKERADLFEFEGNDLDLTDARRRLEILLDLNASDDELVYSRSRSTRAAESDPSYFARTYSFLGLSLGLIPSSAFFIRLMADKGVETDELWILGLFALVVLGSAVTGYFTGKIAGRIVAEVERFSWPLMLASLPFIGITWGILVGGAGGLFLFLIGAIPGAVIGGAVGACALTLFTIFHRSLNKGGELKEGILPPLAVGISALLAAIILGFPVS